MLSIYDIDICFWYILLLLYIINIYYMLLIYLWISMLSISAKNILKDLKILLSYVK